MKDRIVIGTRRSRLALVQTESVAQALAAAFPGLVIERREIVTRGDRDRRTPLAEAESPGLFTREIETRLLEGEIDLAVHSFKDLPTELPEGLMIAATPKRADPRDALVLREAASLAQMPQGAVVGTSSPRRSAQLRVLRPDLVLRDLRGNVETRLGKLARGEYDAIVAARAALDRLDITGVRMETLEPETVLPAPAQGALALECREGDDDAARLAGAINDAATFVATSAERGLLTRLGGGCRLALGALAEISDDGSLRLRAVLLSSDGSRAVRADVRGRMDAPGRVVEECHRRLVDLGADQLLP